MKILLHVGMGKCGSSALQSYLSSLDFERATDGRCLYVALYNDGQLKWGEELIGDAATSVYGYRSSQTRSLKSAFDGEQRNSMRDKLLELGEKYDNLVFSNEGWGEIPGKIAEDCLFADEAFHVSVMLYIRPQIEWLNSAWWQWGAWTKAPMQKWVNRKLASASWLTLLQQWAAKPWVKKVDVRLVDGDVVSDFLDYLGYKIPPQPRSNKGLPGSVLRIFQRNRQLRPGPHDSAIEFALSRHLQLEDASTPWILFPWQIKKFIEYYRQENEQLVHYLPVNQRQKMLEDARWWSAETYSDRKHSSPLPNRLNIDELEQLAVAALVAVARLDTEILRLKQKQIPGKRHDGSGC